MFHSHLIPGRTIKHLVSTELKYRNENTILKSYTDIWLKKI